MPVESCLIAAWAWNIDGWFILIGSLCGVAAALLGNFLVLRKMSMLGDAISHAVLPGLAIAFLISGSRASVPMFIGALIVGVLTAFFTEWIHRVGKVDEGASMGVVFTSLFALGLVLIVQTADRVDLDASCVLYGDIENAAVKPVVNFLGLGVPPAVRTLSIIMLVNILFVVLFYKELKISSFDPELSTSVGINARIMHYALMVLVAVTAVASFEAVGNILVVAMFIVPPAAAYMLTSKLSYMIWLSVLLAVLAAIIGHLAATQVPGWFGYKSTNTAGMMAVTSGMLLMIAVLFAPKRGVVIRWIQQLYLSHRILADDVIALLYRMHEARRGNGSQSQSSQQATFNYIRETLLANAIALRFVLFRLRFGDQLEFKMGEYQLTEHGIASATQLVRSHRLWEQYLVTSAGLDTTRIHDKAEKLEHFTDRQLRDRLDQSTDQPAADPHGTPIPPEIEHEISNPKRSQK